MKICGNVVFATGVHVTPLSVEVKRDESFVINPVLFVVNQISKTALVTGVLVLVQLNRESDAVTGGTVVAGAFVLEHAMNSETMKDIDRIFFMLLVRVILIALFIVISINAIAQQKIVSFSPDMLLISGSILEHLLYMFYIPPQTSYTDQVLL